MLQLALTLLVVFGPSTLGSYPKWPALVALLRVSGAALTVCGAVLGVAALKRLRPSIMDSGSLKPDGTLVTSGPYRFVRHPVYAAQILLAAGWSLAFGGWLTSLFAIALMLVLDRKASMEERRLLQRFPTYRDYQSRTRKLVPFVY